MEFSVATTADIPELCTILGSLFTQEVEFTPDHNLQTQGLTAVISGQGVGAILLARDGGETVAMINLLYTISTALGGRVAILEDMVVSRSAQGQGVGTKLMEFALDFARDNGCKRITLLTDSDNTGAHRFYQRHGFARSSMVVMRKSIDQ
ncbi:MAG: GNAT family N-acetyltransferase [Gammaproteobacteria bacterium]|nr:GNAT family N-acetyltransferase [Gammaproteobacteria bacterium]